MNDTDRLAALIDSVIHEIERGAEPATVPTIAARLLAAGVTFCSESVREAAARHGIPVQDNGLPMDIVKPAPFEDDIRDDRLWEALDDLLDDYLATHGPDGYPQPMPESWHVVLDWLEAGR